MHRGQPEPQRVFLVADVPAALTGLERAPTEGRMGGGVSAGVFFLKPLQAAGRSVASMRAVAFSQSEAIWISGWSNTSWICRNPRTPTRARNAWRMRTSGTSWRCRNRAKERQARCSESKVQSKLSEWTGVSNASRCVRQSCAALNCQRGPRTGRRFHRSLMQSSGMYGSNRSSNWLEPVTGRWFMHAQPTHLNSLRPNFVPDHVFLTD